MLSWCDEENYDRLEWSLPSELKWSFAYKEIVDIYQDSFNFIKYGRDHFYLMRLPGDNWHTELDEALHNLMLTLVSSPPTI